MGVTMFDSFESRGDFHAEVKYAERLDEWLTEWLPNNLSVIGAKEYGTVYAALHRR